MVNNIYRVDFILVEANSKELTQVQQKLNNWITTGTLKKYKSSVVGNQILFEIVRLKSGE